MRMLKIIDLLLEEGRTTVSALSERLKLSTRQVRYDIECINSLHEKKQPLIETDNKGLLYAKDEEDLRALRKNAETLSYSQPQRLLYMRLIIAFDLEAYNLSRIAEELSVSRMTARNDMQLLEQELKENGLSVRYQHGYSLSGSVQSFFAYRCKVIYQLKYLLFKEKLDSMETQLKDHFFRHFFPVRLADVVPVLMSFLHSQNVWLDDAEFHHIYTKVLVILWYSYNNRKFPPASEFLHLSCPDLSELFYQLETIGITVHNDARNYMAYAFQQILQYHDTAKQRYGNDAIVCLHQLLNTLEEDGDERFSRDVFLLSNLYAHLCHFMHRKNYDIPSLKSRDDEVCLDEEMERKLRQFCMSRENPFPLQAEEEIALIRLYLACSIDRMKKQEAVRILFVSGASIQLQLHLLHDLEQYYHVEIVSRISVFELPFFHAWQDVRMVLTTERIPEEFECPVPIQRISLILREEDHHALQQAALPRRRLDDPHERSALEPVLIQQEEQLSEQGTKASELPALQLRFRLSLDRRISWNSIASEEGARYIVLAEAQDAVALLQLLSKLYHGLWDMKPQDDLAARLERLFEQDRAEERHTQEEQAYA